MSVEKFREEIIRLSGSGKRISSLRTHGIYTSFTLVGLDDMVAVRDTKQRFADFCVPERLDGKTVLDVGCNVGAVSFEFAKRGAKVVGVEYRQDRVTLCESIAEYYGLDCKFHSTDLNVSDVTWLPEAPFDIVWCSSVDEYITDLKRFYRSLRSVCLDQLYMESNLQGQSSELVASSMLDEAGFNGLTYMGNGHSGGISRKRKLFYWESPAIVTPSDIEKEVGR